MMLCIMGEYPSTSDTSIHIREICIQPNTDGLDPLSVFSHSTVHSALTDITMRSVRHTWLLVCTDDHSNFFLS